MADVGLFFELLRIVFLPLRMGQRLQMLRRKIRTNTRFIVSDKFYLIHLLFTKSKERRWNEIPKPFVVLAICSVRGFQLHVTLSCRVLLEKCHDVLPASQFSRGSERVFYLTFTQVAVFLNVPALI